jgi:hypothetical protein
MGRTWKWAALAAALGAAPDVRAHELVCEKTVNGGSVVTIDAYPATVTYELTIRNVHATDASVVDWVKDTLFLPDGKDVDVAIPVGESVSAPDSLEIPSYDACVELVEATATTCEPAENGCVSLDNRFSAGWDMGEAQCTARVICCPPETPPPPPPPPDCEGATRTLGFWKTHPDAAAGCLEATEGSIDLGFVVLTSTEELLGFLWGSPARFEDGTRRDELEQSLFLLGRQTAVAICNQTVFGTDDPGNLIAEALEALAGTNCGAIRDLIGPVTDFNESGDEVGFCEGFAPGKADPQAAAANVDPTGPSAAVCTD